MGKSPSGAQGGKKTGYEQGLDVCGGIRVRTIRGTPVHLFRLVVLFNMMTIIYQ